MYVLFEDCQIPNDILSSFMLWKCTTHDKIRYIRNQLKR